jgi:hypothetical protein
MSYILEVDEYWWHTAHCGQARTVNGSFCVLSNILRQWVLDRLVHFVIWILGSLFLSPIFNTYLIGTFFEQLISLFSHSGVKFIKMNDK